MSDDDLFWDDKIPATHNNLMQRDEAAKPKKTVEEQMEDWESKKDLVLQSIIRECGYKYIVIDIQKIINKFAGFSYEWKWSIKYISNRLALHDGFRKVVSCVGPSWSRIEARDKIFDIDSTAIEEIIKFKVHQATFQLKVGINSNSFKDYWFDGKEIKTKIKTQGMSSMKQEMFGSIFGHLDSQQQDSKMKANLKAGDIIQFRVWRQKRDSKCCTIETKYNNQNWETLIRNVSIPCCPIANLYSIGDSVSFIH